MINAFKKILLVMAIVALGCNGASAFDWSQLGSALGGNSSIGNIVNSILSSDSVTVADLAGTWTYSGPAVAFESDNALEKAGGSAISATVESRLTPHYKKAGLEGMKMTFDGKGSMTVTLTNGRTLQGTVKQGAKAGQLIFNLSRLGSSYSDMTVHVTKGTSLSLMLDVSKLQSVVSAVASYSGNSTISSVSSLLSRYKGIYAGFKLTK